MRQFERAYAQIHLDRIEENMKAMQAKLAPGTKMFGVVKADGYGHGAIPVAKTIDAYVFAYAVATAEEAIQLRRYGITKNILILESLSDTVGYDLNAVYQGLKESRSTGIGKIFDGILVEGKPIDLYYADLFLSSNVQTFEIPFYCFLFMGLYANPTVKALFTPSGQETNNEVIENG